ncbi:hypothetical protein AAJ76_100007636 [Vairimorpha ceranae]|uniref:Uncharacterized protein n=1 Tax=Vairimorpha ceranae TaxID=40302 RepID=A0A0F9WES7_9MICR|nr:hypothetical protein AAJ76_100007636 [Vairimorpha ceranae]KKO75856.1 hypothetical protein AAJ76_100007636 [Vairimorpha ceranae]
MKKGYFPYFYNPCCANFFIFFSLMNVTDYRWRVLRVGELSFNYLLIPLLLHSSVIYIYSFDFLDFFFNKNQSFFSFYLLVSALID